MKALRIYIALLILCLLLGGCGTEPVAQDLSQHEANQIVAVLSEQGIPAEAERGSGAGSKYRVLVKGTHYTQANAVIFARKLLPAPKSEFMEIVTPRGLIPNSREVEAVRLDYALSLEIEQALLNLPQVVSAKVLTRMNFLRDDALPSVAVTLRARKGAAVSQDEIVRIVSGALPGVEVSRITVSISEDAAGGNAATVAGALNENGAVLHLPLVPFLYKWRVVEGDYGGLVFSFLALLLIMAIVGVVIGYWYGFYRAPRAQYEGEAADPAVKSLTEGERNLLGE